MKPAPDVHNNQEYQIVTEPAIWDQHTAVNNLTVEQ